MDDQQRSLNDWNLVHVAMGKKRTSSERACIALIAERSGGTSVSDFFILMVTSSLCFFFYILLESDEFTNRFVDMMKIVLTQTTYRFSIEHKL